MENTQIRERLQRLRAWMKERKLQYMLFMTGDYHNSEYVAEYFQVRDYFSGFTGSAGNLLVAADAGDDSTPSAWLWADGRYFTQAEKELAGTGIILMKMDTEGVPTLKAFLSEQISGQETLGFDGRVMPASFGLDIEKCLTKKGAKTDHTADPVSDLWEGRPPIPKQPMYLIEDTLAGEPFEEKCARLRQRMTELNASAHVIAKLDDIMWLTNLRGDDVACNPVALSYLFLTMDECFLFVQPEEVTDAVRDYCLNKKIKLVDYDAFYDFLADAAKAPTAAQTIREGLLYDSQNISYALYRSLKALSAAQDVKLVKAPNPTTAFKAVKNETELRHIREVYLLDSVALVEFMYWVKTNVGKLPMTEVSCAQKLDAMRAELPGFLELSFPTISAYGANAAMAHYEATEDDFSEVKPEGMLLVDSGGTYFGGTTDVTRTMVLGAISDEVKEQYTRTAVGMLRLANARFISGCTGRNLDILARLSLWEAGIDYKHGTGHGIGYMLNVHEGPHGIRWQKRTEEGEETALETGMIVSDEPGVYIPGSHGIRIENILEVVQGETTPYGQFLQFAHLTYAPIDLEAIDTRFMEQSDINALNAYHKTVREKITPFLKDEAVREWLAQETREIS